MPENLIADNNAVEAATPAVETQGSTPEQTAPTPEATENALTIQFNHENISLTRDEAIRLAQLGKLHEQEQGDFDAYKANKDTLRQLSTMAAAAGKTPKELMDAVAEAQEERIYQDVLDSVSGNEELAKRIYNAEKAVREATAKNKQAEAEVSAARAKTETAERIAAEFSDLQKEWPEIADIRALPPQVVEDAAKKGIALTDSYLRYLHAESKKTQANAQKQTEAGKATAGAVSSAKDEDNTLFAAFVAGLTQ